MLFDNDRRKMREVFFTTWNKYKTKLALEPLEQQLLTVILQHPEYQQILNVPANIDKDYFPELGETNPFLHMALHLSLIEQLSTNRPFGIREIYQQLSSKYGSAHNAEHKIIDCMADMMRQAQSSGKLPEDKDYLLELTALLY